MMKRSGKNLLAFLCVFAILVSLPVLAFADEGAASEASRGLAAIEATGDQKYITMPKEDEYLDEFQTRYVDFSSVLLPQMTESGLQMLPMVGPSAPVERDPNPQHVRRMPYAYLGTEVMIVAVKTVSNRKMDCIIYRSSENQMRAGWIWDIYLGDEYPGKTFTAGEENGSGTVTVDAVPMSWSRAGFLGGQQNYSVLEEPVKDCVGFTLDYQVIRENTQFWNSILGPRTIYVNDGTKWLEAGSFEYSELGAVKVQVNLKEPVDIVAIGTIAKCSQPNIFNFRQFASDYRTAG